MAEMNEDQAFADRMDGAGASVVRTDEDQGPLPPSTAKLPEGSVPIEDWVQEKPFDSAEWMGRPTPLYHFPGQGVSKNPLWFDPAEGHEGGLR